MNLNRIVRFLVNLPVIKQVYVGHCMLKNPPTIELNSDMDSAKITNVQLIPRKDGIIVSNCVIEHTTKYNMNIWSRK